MLAQKNRFHGHSSLKYVYRNGDASRSRLFVIKAIQNTRRRETRCSVVVSKKVLKSAVGRNRIRRRIYHILHEEIERLTTPYDIVVIVYSSEVRSLPFEELRTHIKSQLADVGVA